MGARVEEAKPWEQTNTDGSPNFGSYRYQAALGMVELAHELACNAGIEPNRDLVKALAATLITAADAAQAAIRYDGNSDRMDGSHTRARGAVRTAVDAYPPPWGHDETTWSDWNARITQRAVGLLRIAAAVDNNDYPDEPWKTLAGTVIEPGTATAAPVTPHAAATTDERVPYDQAVGTVTEMVNENFLEQQRASRIRVFTAMLTPTDDGTVAAADLDAVIAQIDMFDHLNATEADPADV